MENANTSNKIKYNSKNLVLELCVALVLLNNDFLDPILDGGKKQRYLNDNKTFLSDIKNIVFLNKNRINLGKYLNGKFVIDTEYSNVNRLFNQVEFNIEDDFNILSKARNIARNIIDKVIPEGKLKSSDITNIYWLSINKTEDVKEDMVIELIDGTYISIFINKQIENTKTYSFNSFLDKLTKDKYNGELYSENYIDLWDGLTTSFLKIVYENSKKNIQAHIEKYIETTRIDDIKYFNYLDIKHKNPDYKLLGERIPEFDKNILYLSDLISNIWNNKEECINNYQEINAKWLDIKNVVLNSKILEHLMTDTLVKLYKDDIVKQDDGLKRVSGDLKMNMVRLLVERMDALERRTVTINNGGTSLDIIPEREYFRKLYDDMDVYFDYHVKLNKIGEDVKEDDKDEDEKGVFVMNVYYHIDKEKVITLKVVYDFVGGEMNGRLSAKSKLKLSSNYNYYMNKY